MSRLSDLVHEALSSNTRSDGTIDTAAAVSVVRPSLDGDDIETLVTEALMHRVNNAAKSARASIVARAKKKNLDLPFDGMRDAYSLDLEDRQIKKTESLTRDEFQRVISIREKQIIDDTASLNKLRQAFIVLSPYWDVHPDWTFGQCVAALLAHADAA